MIESGAGNEIPELEDGELRDEKTPKTDQRHVPSGPRDLKDFDQPAYLRRGISLPPIEEETENEEVAVQREASNANSDRSSSQERKDPVRSASARDDRPTFLRKIMD